MNLDAFNNEVKRAISGSPMDITLISKWFEAILESLKVLHKQKAGIRHPRHRGDTRENDLLDAIKPIFPSSIKFDKGFVIDNITSHSREQDILLLNADTASALVCTNGCSYYPIEATLGSIEVKSRLSLSELRKAILNCVSVKRLLDPRNESEVSHGKLWYVIFAYESDWDLKETIKRLNAAVVNVPDRLRPDAVYLLGKGLLIPGPHEGLEIKYRQTMSAGYQGLPSLGTKLLDNSEAYAFLWCITSIVDHCLQERASRAPPSPFSYLTHPILFQTMFESELKKQRPADFERMVDARAKKKKI